MARRVGVAMTASPTQLGWTTRIFRASGIFCLEYSGGMGDCRMPIAKCRMDGPFLSLWVFKDEDFFVSAGVGIVEACFDGADF